MKKIDRFLSTLNRQPNTVSTYRWALSAYFSITGEALSDSNYEKFWTDPHVKGMSESTKRYAHLTDTELDHSYGEIFNER